MTIVRYENIPLNNKTSSCDFKIPPDISKFKYQIDQSRKTSQRKVFVYMNSEFGDPLKKRNVFIDLVKRSQTKG